MDLVIYSSVLKVVMLRMLTDSSICFSSRELNASTGGEGWRSPLSRRALWGKPCIQMKIPFCNVATDARCGYREGPSSRILVWDLIFERIRSQNSCGMMSGSWDAYWEVLTPPYWVGTPCLVAYPTRLPCSDYPVDRYSARWRKGPLRIRMKARPRYPNY